MGDFNEFIGGEENADRFRQTGRAIKSRALAALEEVFKRMPWDQVIEMPGGEQAVIKKFIEPRIKDGSTEFLFDVRDTHDDWHLEILVTISGWGGKPIGEIQIPEAP